MMKHKKSAALSLCLSACLSMSWAAPAAQAQDAQAPDAPALEGPEAPEAPEAPQAGEQTLVLSTLGGTWTVQGEFAGRMSVGAERLALSFGPARLLVRAGAPAGTRRQIVSITPILATGTEKAPFTIARRGKPLAVNREVSLGNPCQVEAFASEIALDNTIDLSKHWLALQIEMTRPDADNGLSYVFINSDHGLFAPKP